MDLLRRARPKGLPPETRTLLEDISRACHACQVYASKPISFQVRNVDDIVFNQEMRLMYIDGRPVPQVVDTGSTFGAATFLDEQSFGSVWNALLRCWSTMYVGFPMPMLTDQCIVFLSRDRKASCAALGIRLRHTGTELHNSLGTGERFHAPLRRIYNKVSLDHPLVPPDVRFAMSVRAMNTTQGPEGLVPIMLLFGKTPVIPHVDQVPVAQAPRLRAMHTAKAEHEKLLAERRIQTALRKKPPPAADYVFNRDDWVYVYREGSKSWPGPRQVTEIDNKCAYVHLGEHFGPGAFNVAQFKPELSRRTQQTPSVLFHRPANLFH
jgi:hypothetical protein